jgi:hypothetical protein
MINLVRNANEPELKSRLVSEPERPYPLAPISY